MQVLAPLGKVNLVAGQNNSGKSNVLRVIERKKTSGISNQKGLTSLLRQVQVLVSN